MGRALFGGPAKVQRGWLALGALFFFFVDLGGQILGSGFKKGFTGVNS